MAKGSTFERKVSKELSLWWTEGAKDDVFWRSTASGARATQRFKRGQKTAGSYGDLTFTDPIGQPLIDLFSIELKAGYSKTLDPFAFVDTKQKEPQLFQFWDQCESDREKSGRPFGMLIFKRDNKIPCMCISGDCFKKIYELSKFVPTSYIRICDSRNDSLNIVCFSYNEFLERIDPKIFILLHKQMRC